MDGYFFQFDLEEKRVAKKESWHYGVRYFMTAVGSRVQIGDAYRHYLILEPRHWNRVLRIIKNDELDKSGVEALLALMETRQEAR